MDGSRDWRTFIACVGASGEAFLPALISSAESKNVHEAWVRDTDKKKHHNVNVFYHRAVHITERTPLTNIATVTDYYNNATPTQRATNLQRGHTIPCC
jgi:hypothetical protein